MNLPSRKSSSPPSSFPTTVTCPAHGLRYDPNRSAGCIRCRATSPPPRSPRRTVLLGGAGLATAALAAWVWWPQAMALLGLRTGAPDPKPLRTTNGSGRTGSYFIPEHAADAPMPLLVYLHGTGGSGREGVRVFGSLAETRGFAICAPDSERFPDGTLSWEVGDRPGMVTDDRRHVMACIAELLAQGFVVDRSHVLAVGCSGGGSSAPYLATNEELFTAFAVLHGGAFPSGFGARRVRGWFSTGNEDNVRPPSVVREAYESACGPGCTYEMHLFPGPHAIGEEERQAVVTWWLAV